VSIIGVPKDSFTDVPLEGAAIAALPVACDGRSSHGRSVEDDLRVAVHEASHCIAARLMAIDIGGATVDPVDGYSGLVWGIRHCEGFGDAATDVPIFCTKLIPLEERTGDTADIIRRVVEVSAGSVGESLLLEGPPWPASHDRAQEFHYASLLCTSTESIKAFVRFCEAQARDLLTPYLAIVTELANVLRARRTLSGEEVDQVIAAALASASVEQEHRRRADWRERVERAATFRAIHRVGGIDHGDYGDYDAHR
jgi:hypothetical protein